MPNPPGANPLVAERAPWRSSQSCVTGGSAAYWKSLQIPVISSAHLATPVRPQQSLVGKALSATRGLAPGGLGTRQNTSRTHIAETPQIARIPSVTKVSQWSCQGESQHVTQLKQREKLGPSYSAVSWKRRVLTMFKTTRADNIKILF